MRKYIILIDNLNDELNYDMHDGQHFVHYAYRSHNGKVRFSILPHLYYGLVAHFAHSCKPKYLFTASEANQIFHKFVASEKSDKFGIDVRAISPAPTRADYRESAQETDARLKQFAQADHEHMIH